ncbi:sigma 54-interacting transcriptional regulator [Metabacillus indicus]|uniref:sigma 54-interacting transcriptional regulator n=1 Tax=Metabacillus indicus TaxID=246786 RepID=UPI003172F62A
MTLEKLIGEHPLFIEKKSLAKKMAASDLPVMLEGPVGSGKQTFAHAIHLASERSARPFASVNCSTYSEAALYEELFGRDQRSGLIESADGGTVFLHEISGLSLDLQAQLLRVLQTKQTKRTGSTTSVPSDVRIIVSSSQDLKALVENGTLRQDFYYHVNVLRLTLPPLSERKTDIPLLSAFFIKERGHELRIDKTVSEILSGYPWPGNILELRNTMDYLLTVCDGRSIQLHDLPKDPFLSKETVSKKEPKKTKDKPLTMMDKQEYLFILESIRDSNEEGDPASRRTISDSSKQTKNPLTPQQVRHRLDFLERNEYVTKGRGRAGTKITLEGLDFLQSLSQNLETIQKEAAKDGILD